MEKKKHPINKSIEKKTISYHLDVLQTSSRFENANAVSRTALDSHGSRTKRQTVSSSSSSRVQSNVVGRSECHVLQQHVVMLLLLALLLLLLLRLAHQLHTTW
jgi:hypothetical protein